MKRRVEECDRGGRELQFRAGCVASLILLALAPTPVMADSCGPFANYLQVDPTGRFYVVIAKTEGWGRDPGRGGPVEFTIAERKPGSPPVSAQEDHNDGYEVTSNPKVALRKGDIRHGHGSLARAPRQILVSSTGHGFVTLDVFGYNYGNLRSDDALVVVSKDGTIRHRKCLIDLFDETEIANFLHTAGGVFWNRGGWIDEGQREVVVVGDNDDRELERRAIRVINLETGSVRAGSEQQVLTAIAEKNRGGLNLALEMAIEMKLEIPHMNLLRVLTSEDLPGGTRVRAAVLFAKFGDLQGAEFVANVARKKSASYDEGQAYAISHLRELLGADAAAILKEVVHNNRDHYYHEVWREFREIGQASIPTLVELLKDESDPHGQYLAAECLGDLHAAPDGVVPTLIKFLSKTKTPDSPNLHSIAIYALRDIGPPAKEALPHLEKIAQTQKTAWENGNAEAVRLQTREADSKRIGLRLEYERTLKAIHAIRASEDPTAHEDSGRSK